MSECYKAIRKHYVPSAKKWEGKKNEAYRIENLYYAKYDFLTQVFICLSNQWRMYVLLYTEIAGDS